jgi:hypothetical protein
VPPTPPRFNGEWRVAVLGISLLGLALIAMAMLHENHYRSRRERVSKARGLNGGVIENVYARLAALEEIVCEDRFT